MSADVLDNASEAEALLLAASLSNVPKNKPIEAQSRCLCCDAPLVQDAELPKRWCDAVCRDDWQGTQR